MKRITQFLVLISLASFLFHGCEENTTEMKPDMDRNTSGKQVSSEMLIFSSISEYESELEKISNFTENEFKKWEKEKNFKSFGSVCDEFYKSIEPEKFENKEEMMRFLNENSKYLQIIEEENGEITVEPLLDEYTERYFINKDNMFQIGNKVIKIFPEGKVSCDVSNTGALRNLGSPETIKNNEAFTFTPQAISDTYTLNENAEKDWSYNCGNEKSAKKTDGKNRIKLNLWFIRDNSTYPYPLVFSYLVKPQKKTFGAWFGCSRTLSTHIQVRFDYYDGNRWKYDYADIQKTKKGRSIRSNGALAWIQGKYSFHMGGIDAWATHPGISGKATIRCNPSVAHN